MNKIIVTGAGGFVGKNLINRMKQVYSTNQTLCYPIYKKLYDLTDKYKIKSLFKNIKPTHVIHMGSKVAGLGGHKGKHFNFLDENCQINLNVLRECLNNNVQNVLAISSIAAFPITKTVLTEELFNTGEPHESEIGYSTSKLLLDRQIQLLRKEYNLNYCNIIPTNIFGPLDNFNLETSHVIPSLIHKFYLAIQNNTNIEIWGDGESKRQFIFVEDLVDILIKLLDFKNLPDRLIIAHPKVYSIKDVVNILIKITKFKGKIIYDTSKPNGLRARECSIDRLNSLDLGPPPTDLEQGLLKTWDWFNSNYPNIRL